MKRFLVGTLLLLCSAAAQANWDSTAIYYGMAAADSSVDVPGNGSRSLGTVNATLGVRLNSWLGLEFEGAMASDDPGSIFSEPLAQYQAGMLRIGRGWRGREAYLLFGHARLDLDPSLNPSRAGHVIGAGLSLFGSDSMALNFNLLTVDGGTFRTASIGFRYLIGQER